MYFQLLPYKQESDLEKSYNVSLIIHRKERWKEREDGMGREDRKERRMKREEKLGRGEFKVMP